MASVIHPAGYDWSANAEASPEIRSSSTRVIPTITLERLSLTPEDGTVGNTPRDFLRGPGLSQWDITLAKNTKFGTSEVNCAWEYTKFSIAQTSRDSVSTMDLTAPPRQLTETPDVAAGNPVIATEESKET